MPQFCGRPRGPVIAAVAAAAVCLSLSVAPAGPRRNTATTGWANTPPIGCNDWNAYGCNVSADLIEGAADHVHDSGMQAAGYRYVNIDDCWPESSRNSAAELVPDPVKFPQRIAAVADDVDGIGLKLGIYEDAGTLRRAPATPAASDTSPKTPRPSPTGASTT